MATLTETYTATTQLNLWYKTLSGDPLMLSDVSTILPLRWTYFKNSWEFIRPAVIAQIPYYSDPDFLNQQISDFTTFIQSQRNSNANINPFNDTVILNRFYAIFDNIAISSIQLTTDEQNIIQNAVTTVSNYSKNDFVGIKNTLRSYRDRYADTVSLNDDSYNSAYGISSIPAQVSATIQDANYLLSLQNAIKSVDFILANYFATEATIDLFALARQNANNPDINIGQYSSGRLVKVEYGEDLEALAYKYLGDPNKWLDIAIANGLKPPYIDEVGEKIPLIANGNGNQINLAGTDVNGNSNIDKIYINQSIFIRSNTEVAPDSRKITNIRQVPISDEIIIELNGDLDLDRYHIADNASIRVFKPNTINSGVYVLIPSTDPLPDGRKDEVPWFLANASDDEKQAKVDLSVSDGGDLVFAPNGDFKLSYGLDNAIQAIKFKISTELGSLRLHPQYGLVNIMGQKNANFTAIQTAVTQSVITQIQADSRFDRVEKLNVDFYNNQANAVLIELVVRLAGGGDKVIPISFTVNI